MPTLYLLPSCKTCQRIRQAVEPAGTWAVRDIKSEPLTESEVDAFAKQAGSYEALFSRRAMLYRQRGLSEQSLTEADFKRLLLEHYTFLKRPVLQVGDALFVGSSKKAVEGALAALSDARA